MPPQISTELGFAWAAAVRLYKIHDFSFFPQVWECRIRDILVHDCSLPKQVLGSGRVGV